MIFVNLHRVLKMNEGFLILGFIIAILTGYYVYLTKLEKQNV